MGDLKQGLHKSSKATAIPTNYKHSNVPNDFEEEFKEVKIIFALGGTDAYYLGFNVLQNRSTLTTAD